MKKILIPIDGSENSLEGIKLLKSLGVCKNNQIYLLNVQTLMSVPYEDFLSSGSKEGLIDHLIEQGKKVFDKAKAILAEEEFRTEVKVGEPETEIISYANQIGADLIIVGAQGKTGLKALAMGSVSTKLLANNSPIPVLVTGSKKEKVFKNISDSEL